ncbi:MAG: YfiR family protein [Bacteroidales bacterium]
MIYSKPTYNPNPLSQIRKFCLLLVFFSTISANVFSQTDVNTLKAVYLEKFSRFITWPKECNIEQLDQPFIIAVFGNTKLTQSLQMVYSQQEIYNKRVIIKEITELKDINDCHILFIAESEKKELQKILSITNGLPILTVSETEGMAKKGVIINFFEENNKLRFEINESSLLKSPLKMSYYLLSTARIIDPVSEKR